MLLHNMGFWLNVSLLLTASSVNKERNQTSISWYIYIYLFHVPVVYIYIPAD